MGSWVPSIVFNIIIIIIIIVIIIIIIIIIILHVHQPYSIPAWMLFG